MTNTLSKIIFYQYISESDHAESFEQPESYDEKSESSRLPRDFQGKSNGSLMEMEMETRDLLVFFARGWGGRFESYIPLNV